jgi:hypothetical protein
VEINGKIYSDRKPAGNQLAIAVVEAPMREESKIGRYRGFDLYVEKFKDPPTVFLTRSGPQYAVALRLDEPGTAFNSADANLRQADARRADAVERLESLDRDVETAKAEVDKPFKRAEELEEKRQRLDEIQKKIEELYDQRPGREVRKLACRLEKIDPAFMNVIGGVARYDLGAVRVEMADMIPRKGAFDRWVLALGNVGIVQLHEADGVLGQEAELEAHIQEPQTGRQFAKISLQPNWEQKAAEVPSVAAFIEAEAFERVSPTAALQQIADLEKNDPSGIQPWKELALEAGAIAREAIAGVDAMQTGKKDEPILALQKIAALSPVDSDGRIHSWKELAETAIETATHAAAEIATPSMKNDQAFAAGVERLEAFHDQSIG